MGFKIKYPFTFPHGKCIVFILSDQYKGNYISYDMTEMLSMHPKAGRFCFHKEWHFIIQFESEKYSDSAEYSLHEGIFKGYQVILWKKWFNERKTTLNQVFRFVIGEYIIKF